LTRSAAVRLSPVADALGGEQLVMEPTGVVVEWRGGERSPRTAEPRLSAGQATRAVAAAIESVSPDVVLLAGDSDCALAGALAATRAGVPIARLGAGLRCDDRGIEREINRIAIDELATRLYADDEAASERLRLEGVDESRVRVVGSTIPAAVDRWRGQAHDMRPDAGGYVLVYLHRNESFANVERLTTALIAMARRLPVVVCLDATRRAALASSGSIAELEFVANVMAGPVSYVEFLSLTAGAGAVLTDSAGVQEESTVLGIPCFTLARSSERTLTLTHGTNVLLGEDPETFEDVSFELPEFSMEPIPEWDRDAGRRVAADLLHAPWGDA
jgi:UDP-N-acetylglucosamine 2-epimerase (non-hydrolysing)